MKTACGKVLWTVGLMGVSAAALADGPKSAPPQEPAGFITGGSDRRFRGGAGGRRHRCGIGHVAWKPGAPRGRGGQSGSRKRPPSRARRCGCRATWRPLRAPRAISLKPIARSPRGSTSCPIVWRRRRLPTVRRRATMRPRCSMGCRGTCCSAPAARTSRRRWRMKSRPWRKPSPSPRRSRSGWMATPIRAAARILNLKLSEARADAVRDLFLAAGVNEEALEVNAYGKSRSVAEDSDGYALERRVRLTLEAAGGAPVAQMGGAAPTAEHRPPRRSRRVTNR